MGLLDIFNRKSENPKNLNLSWVKVSISANLIPIKGNGTNVIQYRKDWIQRFVGFGLQKINRRQHFKNKYLPNRPKFFFTGLKLLENILRKEGKFPLFASGDYLEKIFSFENSHLLRNLGFNCKLEFFPYFWFKFDKLKNQKMWINSKILCF